MGGPCGLFVAPATERQYRSADKAMRSWTIVMTRRSWAVALWGAVLMAIPTCDGNVGSVTDCPSYVVVLDGGAHGFSSLGEWRTDSVCTNYCHADHPVCQLATPTSVKCQKGCE